MNYKDVIQTDEVSARAVFTYHGQPEGGMLAWLDSKELQDWWRADSAIVEPFQGGMFYITWHEADRSEQHAIYGIMDRVDTETNTIEINKIMYISPKAKMGHLHLYINFERVDKNETKVTFIHTHNYRGGLQLRLYNEAVYESWPKTFSLLKRYLEKQTVDF